MTKSKALLLILFIIQDVIFFVTPFTLFNNKSNNIHLTAKSKTAANSKQNNFIDAEFYPSEDEEKRNNKKSSSKSTSSSTATATATATASSKKVSPLQASLSSLDPKLSSLSVNFLDSSPNKSSLKQSFIPCRLAFTTTYNGVEYVLGTPTDTQVAIYVEDTNTNTAYFLDPDEDDNVEIMERAASVFDLKYKHISLADEDDEEDISNSNNKDERQKLSIRFKRTPRTLTVEGDLSMITGNWKKDELNQVDEITDVAKGILDEIEKVTDSKEDDEFFDSFFTKELGSNYKEAAFANREIDDKVDELMDLFNVPGLGMEQDDDVGIQDLMGDIFSGRDEELAKAMAKEEKDGDAETALRLIWFSDENDGGKVYSLVQLLQPMILVAKNDPSLELDERLLLTPEESEEIIPLLEQQFQEEFADAGISLKP
jgi:hypothetical protein